MQNQDFHHQIVSDLKKIDPVNLFKIFGEEYFSFQRAQYPNVVDWSAFYTQLTPAHSMRYLTKKWSDGSDFACLIRLIPINESTRILELKHQKLASPKIAGQLKAANIKKHLSQKYTEFKDVCEHLLLEFLGRHQIIMICVDSEDQEYIIPHQMLQAENFLIQNLLHFKKSQDGMLRTVNYRFSDGNWLKTPNDYQFEPYMIVQDQKNRAQIEKIIKQGAGQIKKEERASSNS